MAISRVQFAVANGLSSTASATFSGASTPGNFLTALVAVFNNTSSAPSGYSTAITNTSTTFGIPVYLYYLSNAAATTTISSSLGGSARWIMITAEYSGIVASSALDQTGSAISGSDPIPSGSVTTTFTNELIVAGLSDSAGDGYATPLNGFTLVASRASGAQSGAAYLDFITTSTGTFSTGASGPGGGNGIIASFKSTGSTTNIKYNAIWHGSVF